MSNPTDHTDLDETEDEEDEVDEDEDEEDTEPCCPECDTPLKEYTHVGGGYDGFGYGCPSCFMQFCPFCRKAFLRNVRVCRDVRIWFLYEAVRMTRQTNLFSITERNLSRLWTSSWPVSRK